LWSAGAGAGTMVSVSSETVVPAEGEHLTNGWDSAVAVEDTLIRRAAHVQASWPITLAQATGRPWRHTDAWAGAFLAERGELSNPVVLLRPPTDLASLVAEIDDIVPTTSTYFLLSPWLHVDLSPHGLVLLGHPPLMVRFPGSAVPRLRADVDLHEVHTVEELVLAERVLVEGYPMPHLQPLTPGDLWPISVLSEKTRIWLAYVDGEPAATAAAHLDAGATLVEYVATLPVARGRGAGTAVTWAATAADPGRPAVLVASDDGRPVYEALGYVAIERWTAWLRPAAPA